MGAGASTNLAWEPSVLGDSAAEIIKQIRSGERTCVAVVQASLDRITLLETSELESPSPMLPYYMLGLANHYVVE